MWFVFCFAAFSLLIFMQSVSAATLISQHEVLSHTVISASVYFYKYVIKYVYVTTAVNCSLRSRDNLEKKINRPDNYRGNDVRFH